AIPTIEPGSSWENGYIDSFNARRTAKRQDLLREAQILIESCPRRAEEQRSSAHYSHRPDYGIRCVSARLPRWRLYLFVVQSGHQDFRDAMPIYISRGRFRRPLRAQPYFRSPLIAEKSPAR